MMEIIKMIIHYLISKFLDLQILDKEKKDWSIENGEEMKKLKLIKMHFMKHKIIITMFLTKLVENVP